jgi:hypothetical protein
MGASRTLLARAISPIFNDLGRNSSELVTNLRLSDRRHIAAAVVYFEHISCAVKFHAYTLDNSSDLASAVQQKLPFPTGVVNGVMNRTLVWAHHMIRPARRTIRPHPYLSPKSANAHVET